MCVSHPRKVLLEDLPESQTNKLGAFRLAPKLSTTIQIIQHPNQHQAVVHPNSTLFFLP